MGEGPGKGRRLAGGKEPGGAVGARNLEKYLGRLGRPWLKLEPAAEAPEPVGPERWQGEPGCPAPLGGPLPRCALPRGGQPEWWGGHRLGERRIQVRWETALEAPEVDDLPSPLAWPY